MAVDDAHFLREAIRLSREQMQANQGGPFGAVIVRNDTIIASGWNRVTSANDPTAHAEVVAIRNACEALDSFSLSGCTLYSSCEPCPMCLSAIYWSRLDRLVYAADRHDAAAAGFDDAFLYEQLALAPAKRSLRIDQTLSDEARAVFTEWLQKPDRISY